ncbi:MULTISPECIES: 50S ribosomal protein L29 [Desulfovibrio]|jgi:large subunit ribosomal protein L29|uniref:50S ribosomal protein L29 n=1 Tax=Desulfovibrio TaxID=872 RepID=UPI00041E3FB4|nr:MULTISPECIES: 50S ribosomal protein L29 [Desulfovibrio]MCM0753724.1 50S ribosomal protein L29 [Desulfovibrio aminophilus]MDY0305392.1 50S ribosomal protein L29 [Desulfovibrionaceae bacterium]HMM37844.1 50S ribosomal protein L29 [Desulfovibrio sp.]
MKSKEIRALDDKQLGEKLGEFRKELFNLRFQHATAQLENTQRIPTVKKTIARILTVQRERNAGA